MVIQVLLKDPRSGSEKKYEFDQSPVRIGRNPLNNVVLEGNFVSGWHGIIRFDDNGAYYFDLGSTNGTCIDGKRLQKNTATPILQPTRLTVWMFEIFVTPGAASIRPTPQPRPAVLGTLAQTGRNTEVFQTVEPPQAPAHAQTSPSRIIPVGGRAPTPSRPMNASDAQPAHVPHPAQEQPQDRLVRCLRIIGAFCDAFMGLKKGYEQFGSEVGVRPLTGTTPLHRARTSQELVEYLLDPAIDPDACARDLNAVFADMGIHDVALMEGISQSVHSLLAKLDPNALDFKMGSGLWSGSKAKGKWNTYVETFNNLLGEDAALHAEIFGEEFASAYASVALGDENAAQDEDE
jgi:predicted component of type VI protein secretion system